MRFKFTGATPGELANGRPLAYGDVVDLNRREVALNARLIDTGALQRVPPRKRPSRSVTK